MWYYSKSMYTRQSYAFMSANFRGRRTLAPVNKRTAVAKVAKASAKREQNLMSTARRNHFACVSAICLLRAHKH